MRWVFGVTIIIILTFTGCTEDNYDGTFKDYSKTNLVPINISKNISENSTQISNVSVPIVMNFDQPYHIGAFNIQVFGRAKLENTQIMPIIRDVINDYDIIGIQEIRDNTGAVIKELQTINNVEVSPRLGRTRSKEQYAFVYSDRVKLLNSEVYPDHDDVFEREPFVASFRLENVTMVFVLIHVKPTDAENEIQELEQVVDWTAKSFNSQNIFIMGDLNSDCSYASEGIFLQDYHWLIGDEVDTTTTTTNCTYDRIISVNSIVPIEIGVDNMSEEVGTDMDLLRAVSDHFPVRMII